MGEKVDAGISHREPLWGDRTEMVARLSRVAVEVDSMGILRKCHPASGERTPHSAVDMLGSWCP